MAFACMKRQIDGNGGADPLASKCGPWWKKSGTRWRDVDYLFLQVFLLDQDEFVNWRTKTAGNILGGHCPRLRLERQVVWTVLKWNLGSNLMEQHRTKSRVSALVVLGLKDRRSGSTKALLALDGGLVFQRSAVVFPRTQRESSCRCVITNRQRVDVGYGIWGDLN